MFYFDEINGNKVLKSDLLNDTFHCFTTRGVKLSSMISSDKINLVSPVQTHSDNVELVGESSEYLSTDGLILTQKNTMIALRFADCTPLIFYDKKQKIGAVTHAGWRGTAKKIAVKTIQKMKSNPNDIIAIIGPAIGICCYEVSEDVKIQLLKTVNNNNDLYNCRNVDLKKINARQLEEIGVAKIDICPYCTSCNNDLFYSYRKEKGTSERHFGIFML